MTRKAASRAIAVEIVALAMADLAVVSNLNLLGQKPKIDFRKKSPESTLFIKVLSFCEVVILILMKLEVLLQSYK